VTGKHWGVATSGHHGPSDLLDDFIGVALKRDTLPFRRRTAPDGAGLRAGGRGYLRDGLGERLFARSRRPHEPATKGGSVKEASMTGEVIRLSVPASLEFVRILRLTASGIASGLGFDVEEVENIRVAVDELASLVLERADGTGTLDVEFMASESELRIEGRVPAPDGALLRAEELTALILKALTDDYDLRVDGGFARFSCARQLPSD
jgi:serine/threonine-protein kinase RsbW